MRLWGSLRGCKGARATAPLTTLLLLLLPLLFAQTTSGNDQQPERLIGWRGESYNHQHHHAELQQQQQRGAGAGASAGGGGTRGGDRWIERLSLKPRAFLFHHFLSDDECDHVISLVEKRVFRSSVIDTETGAIKLDPIRTSYGSSIDRGHDAVIAAIEQRIAEWTHLPPENGEALQVLRYNDGQEYAAHWDTLEGPPYDKTNDNRAATVLLYLSNVEAGGETALPIAVPLDGPRLRPPPHIARGLSKCGANGSLAVVPRKGDALLFFDMLADGLTADRRSLHASCPTLKGTKWTATKWIHNKPYGSPDYDPLALAAKCEDKSPDCAALAAAGGCVRDAAAMVGLRGKCRRACKDCVECAENDVLCMRRNLRSRALGQQQPLGGVGSSSSSSSSRIPVPIKPHR